MSNLFSNRLSVSRLFLSKPSISRDWQILLWILLGGWVARLAALPFSMTTEQDAVVRVDLARTWLENPTWILDGIWLPLQTYYMAIAIWLTRDWLLTPILLNFCFSVGAAIPLYFFTKREFGRGLGQSEAGFVAAAFVLYPMAFRNSLMAMSDTPFTFFVVVGLWALSRARTAGSKNLPGGLEKSRYFGQACLFRAGDRDAFIAGGSMTLAAALRYEGWALILPMALLLWRSPRKMSIFLGFALVTPLIWMAGNGLLRGDYLYSLKYQVIDTATSLAQRGGMSSLKRFVRAIFIPSTLAIGMTLPLFGLCGWGAVHQMSRRTQKRMWLIPFGFLLGLLCYKSVAGTMNLQPRYTLILGVLLLPFSASALAQIHSLRRRNLLKFLILLLMLPLSYMLHVVRPALTWALSDTQMVKRETPASLMEAIPRLAPSTQDTIRLVRQQFQPTDGLFVADLPEIGYLVLYPMGLPMSQLEIIPHGLQTLDARRKAGQFLRRRSQGLLLANEQTFAGGSSSLARRGASDTRLVQTAAPDEINLPIHWQPTPDCSVVLWRVGSVEGAVLYRYEVINR